MRALLDVNVLIALLDATHVHHARANAWLAANIKQGWASCPITQNGCLRIVSHPRYANPVALSEAASRLREAQDTKWHEFWGDSISVLDETAVVLRLAHGSAQLTDLYLLALATRRNGRFVTFDRRIPRQAVPAARPHNLVQI